MKRIYINYFIILAGISCLLAACTNREDNIMHQMNNNELETGQIWKYDNREGEDSSTLTILKIEQYKRGETSIDIIHVRIDDLKIVNPQVSGGFTKVLGHMPFSREAIMRSLTEFESKTDMIPDFKDGYDDWKELWDKGKAGYWSTEVKEAVNAVALGMK